MYVCYAKSAVFSPYINLVQILILRPIPVVYFNPLNAELNPICHLLALLGAHHILHVSRIRVKSAVNYHNIDQHLNTTATVTSKQKRLIVRLTRQASNGVHPDGLRIHQRKRE